MNIDKGEDLMGTIRDQMHGQNISAMSIRVGVSKSALYNLRSGKTRWPRDTTTFCALHAMGLQMKIERRK